MIIICYLNRFDIIIAAPLTTIDTLFTYVIVCDGYNVQNNRTTNCFKQFIRIYQTIDRNIVYVLCAFYIITHRQDTCIICLENRVKLL